MRKAEIQAYTKKAFGEDLRRCFFERSLCYERTVHPNQFPSDYFFSALAELVLDD